MIKIGHTYSLPVLKCVDFGVYLDADNLGEVLLPQRLLPEQVTLTDLAPGDELHVFLHLDSEDRLLATAQQPKITVGQFAYLEVKETNQVGAFLDWGLDKDLLVPFAEQYRPMRVGQSYIVYAYVSERDGRIVASSKIDKFVSDEKPQNLKPNQAVSLLIANTTDLGFKAIIDHQYWGVLYQNEVFQALNYGETIAGFIKSIRPDGKIDLTLNGGQQSRDTDCDKVLNHLRAHNGVSALHDKSPPQQISAELGISKSAFKKAIGRLYKQHLIALEAEGIRLIE